MKNEEESPMTGPIFVSGGRALPAAADETLTDRFRTVLMERPEAETFRFLIDGEGKPVGIANADLDTRARAIAVILRQRVPAGARALIICPPGIDYVASFLACLYAGVIAVPVYPPNPALLKRSLPRLVGVVADASPAIVLAPAAISMMAMQLGEMAPELTALPWQNVDDIDVDVAGLWLRPDIDGATTAFLQYTSGSTGQPKGVIVSHANLLHNLAATHRLFVGDDTDTHSVIWLPPYHDMGLIGGLLQPAYGGFPVTFMSPLAFLKHPVRWLRAISEYGATHSGGPNFAYDLCVAKVSDQDRASLDLSRWRLAFTGAEPVRADTIERFTNAFGASGFRLRAFYPCYGLAESTLFVSGGDRDREPLIRNLDAGALTDHSAIEAVDGEASRTSIGCGSSIPGQDLVIVDTETGEVKPENSIGEVWVRGPSVAGGYWNRPAETRETFEARIRATGEGPYLRTGDLGFLDGAELFVTGRVKDLIIVAGKNHYPQDIEHSVEASSGALRHGCGVACSVDLDGEEQLVIIYELASNPARLDIGQIVSGIRTAVAEQHGLQVHDVVLLRQGGVPKTSSGKLQRAACKAAFLAGSLEPVEWWNLSASTRSSTDASVEPVVKHVSLVGRSETERRLTHILAERLHVAPESLDPTQPIAAYGLQSIDMVGMVGELEQWLGRTLPATLAWEYPTIEALATFLSTEAVDGSLTSADPTDAEMHTAAPAAGPVAIIGIGCRFPGGANDAETFWQLLCDGRDTVTEIPTDRWNIAEFLDENPSTPGMTNTRWGGFIDGIDQFDPQFFGISPVEAARMDPQQRILAEVAWEALEDAGVVAQDLAGSATGVFIGISTNDYGNLQFQDLDGIDAYAGTGNASSIAANRLSYLFDLRGPSMAIDTACSSSLVAVHQACMSLARGDCTVALAGGVNAILSPALAINFSKAGAMASDGRCKAFDARADGYVRAEGAGIVVLKPLAAALADNDSIYAVITGGAVNQDGRTNGLMAPNPHAQEALLRSAYADAGIDPKTVQYVEAHGTGTLLGDPIEAKALAAVVGVDRDPAQPCLIGSVKSNLGHLEAAAGIAGLIKVALMARHRMIPPSLHFQQPNPHIPFQDLNLRVATDLRPWPTEHPSVVVGVSAFGFGGTNAHLVVLESPRPASTAVTSGARRTRVMTISARDAEALRALAEKYEALLVQPHDELTAERVSFATTVRRSHHEHRLIVGGQSTDDFRQGLAAFRRGEERPGTSWGARRISRRPAPVFVFSGQGPRWWPIGSDLFDAEPAFREMIERCDGLLRRDADWSLTEQLTAGAPASRLIDPGVAQPALCALQIALATLWCSWGIVPKAVVGHSVGEIAAAYVAGALTLPDALRVALHRGGVIQATLGKGRMAAAGMSYDQGMATLARLAIPAVSVAASNGPESIVFSGETSALEKLVHTLDSDGVFCRLLESVDYASHGPQMDEAAAELATLLVDIDPHPVTTPMVSTVTGRSIGDTRLNGDYWARNLRQPVLFDRAVKALLDAGHDTFIEVSPHPMLGDAIGQRMAAQHVTGAVVATLRRDEPTAGAMVSELGQLYTAGYPVDWSKIYGRTGTAITLPTYAWQRQRYWFDDGTHKRRTGHGIHPVLQTSLRPAAAPGASYSEGLIDLDSFPYLADHQVETVPVLPASLLLDTALTAARQLLGDDSTILEDVRFTQPTVVGAATDASTIQLVLLPETAGIGEFRIFTRTAADAVGQDWTQVADGRFRGSPVASASPPPSEDALAAAQARCVRDVEVDAYYAALSQAGLPYGPCFQGIAAIRGGTREAVARIRPLAELTADRDPYLLHPALLDSCLQVLAAAINPDTAGRVPTYLPVAIDRFTVAATSPVVRWAHASIGVGDLDSHLASGRVVLYGEAGTEVGRVDGITLRRIARDSAPDSVADALLEVRWHEVTAAPETSASPPTAGTGSWLVFSDHDGVGESLRATIGAHDGHCITVTTAGRYRRLSDIHYAVNPLHPEDFVTLLADIRGSGAVAVTRIVHTWSLDPSPEPGANADTPPRSSDAGGVSVLHLVQALAHEDVGDPPRLVMVTRGVQAVDDRAQAPALSQAALWGLARVILLEHRELHPKIIDLDPVRSDDESERLFEEVNRLDDESQLCLRLGRRYSPRLEPWSAPADDDTAVRRPFDPDRDSNYRILATHPGILGSLTPTVWQRTPPGPGQIEIEITAAALNFSDVLKAFGICPGVPSGTVPLGAECAGRVTAVGRGVTEHAIGDAVMAVAPSSMAAFATTAAHLVAAKPQMLTDDQAAATPIAFLTAIYGLEYLAHLGDGETVLIHSATGGVGLAAVQVAHRAGAKIFATAGTEEKRALLRTLGVTHVMDSRSLRFAEHIMELTGGRGVDVVLNSLTGEALTRSLSLLAPNGRFVEIGKQDVYGNSHIGLEALKHNRSLFAVDLERSFAEQPDLIAGLFNDVTHGFANGDFHALPVTTFFYSAADEAFGFMAQARHIGKIVLRPDGHETVDASFGGRAVTGTGTYLITGGLGALGLETANYLVDQGARHLALIGRHPPSAAAEVVIARLRSAGAEIRLVRADVSGYDAVTAVLAEIDTTMPRLAGIVHAAGTLDDALVTHLDRERFQSVAAAKADGAWHLHRATRSRDLDFFVLYSSAAALLGSPGQGNYAAANASLDALALYRRARGLPALSIAWGPWSDIGLAAEPGRGQALSSVGIVNLSPAQGIAALRRLIHTTSAAVCVLPMDRRRIHDAAASGLLPDLLVHLAGAPATESAEGGSGAVRSELLAVAPGRRRRALLVAHCMREAGRVLKLDVSRIDATAPLASMGFDSLMSLELRVRLERSLQVKLPATVAWQFPSIEALVPFLADRMGVALDPVADVDITATDAASLGDDIDAELAQLTDGDVESLLLAKIMHIDEGGRR